jgi:hypothetical protein
VSSRPEDQGLHAAILMKRSWRALAGLGGCMALLLTTGLLTPTSATAATAARAVTTAPAGDSSAGVWASIFGTGSDSLIPHTYEWTYEPETTNYSGAYPYGWCLDHGAGPCAQFFGGQTSASPYALMWQWSGGGGATNGIGGFNGDLDTIDSTRQN